MVLCFSPTPFPVPSPPLFCREGLWPRCSLPHTAPAELGGQGCPPEMSFGSHTGPHALARLSPSHTSWCSFPASRSFLRWSQAWTKLCFQPALPFFFQTLSLLLHPRGKGARSHLFPPSLGSRTCRAAAEIPSCHSFHLLKAFSYPEDKLNPIGYL